MARLRPLPKPVPFPRRPLPSAQSRRRPHGLAALTLLAVFLWVKAVVLEEEAIAFERTHTRRERSAPGWKEAGCQITFAGSHTR